MSGSTGDSDFGFSEILDIPGIKGRTTLRSRGNKTRCFQSSQTVTVLPYIQMKTKNDTAMHTNLKQFQGARPGPLRIEFSSCGFRGKLERFD